MPSAGHAAILFNERLFQRTTVDTHADRHAVFLCLIHHSLHPLRASDVARIDADFVCSALHGCNGQAVIKNDVCHQRMWIWRLMAFKLSAASMVGTATRMISQPACSSLKIWATVAAASSVFVLHIDWIRIGFPPPIFRFPIRISFVILRSICYSPFYNRFRISLNNTSTISAIKTAMPAICTMPSLSGSTGLAAHQLNEQKHQTASV